MMFSVTPSTPVVDDAIVSSQGDRGGCPRCRCRLWSCQKSDGLAADDDVVGPGGTDREHLIATSRRLVATKMQFQAITEAGLHQQDISFDCD
jgi:hypothetical protein